MKEKRIILAPVDFSETSDRALRQAHTLAKTLNKDLLIIYVIEDSGGWLKIMTKAQQNIFEEAIREKLEVLRLRAEKFSEQKVSFEILRGKPYIKILEKAEELQAAFIVMGNRGDMSHKAETRYVGNNASKVARSAPCPVITVSNKVVCHNLRSILLPLDLTRETRQKVTNAIELAKKFNAKIKVMSALLSTDNDSEQDQLNVIINQVVTFIRKAGIECDGEIVESSSDAKSEVPIILKYADEQGDIDMILIMTQPELGFFDFFISSNALEMLKKSLYPVMSVQPKNLERTSILAF